VFIQKITSSFLNIKIVQVPMDVQVPASWLLGDPDHVIQCTAPPASFIGPVMLRVSLNGQDFVSNAVEFQYKGKFAHSIKYTFFDPMCLNIFLLFISVLILIADNWFAPAVSGIPPSPRIFQTFTLVPDKPQRILLFGGFNGQFRDDLQALYLGTTNIFLNPSPSSLGFLGSPQAVTCTHTCTYESCRVVITLQM
jgi:hypothetical protein